MFIFVVYNKVKIFIDVILEKKLSKINVLLLYYNYLRVKVLIFKLLFWVDECVINVDWVLDLDR